jgi:hypothetical protein
LQLNSLEIFAIMSLSSLPLMKEVLGTSLADEEWLQSAMISVSPFGDFIVIASNKCAVFYVKKFNNTEGEDEKVYFKLSKTYYPEPHVGSITAVTYLPVRLKLVCTL